MRIAFLDFIGWDYQVESVYQMPMGGSQSALCYLAEAIAKLNHDVFLLNCTSISGLSRGVTCMPWRESGEILPSLDALIVLSLAGQGRQIRQLVGKQTQLILWLHTIPSQPVVEILQNSEERDAYDGFALISEWQREQYYQYFNIDSSRTCILRNAIASTFSGVFPKSASIVKHKSQPPVLAYTSTPFRGLDILLEVFPKIRATVPGTRLKVFSSMKVYQISETEDEYTELYRQCQATEGVEYIGSIPQPDLARQLESITVLAYPNTYPETSCITVMEAMASGCRIVTSDLAALPETTAGFANLIPIEDNWEVYKHRFIEATVQILRESMSTDNETHLRRQVNYINNSCTWSVRAQEWVEWLSSLTVKSIGIISSAYLYLIQGEYSQAATLYEQAIEDSETISNYWYLGLAYLLQGEVAQAQATWMFPLMNCEPEQLEEWTADLVKVLSAEAQRWESIENYQTAELIRQQIREITADFASED